MADEPPKPVLVAEAEPHELEKAEAARQLSWETRELAANLLRVIRGAGKPQILPQQIIDLSERIIETHKSARAWAIWSAMEEALQSAIPDWLETPEYEAHIGTIAEGSLQYVASRLVRQHAQEAAGERQIASGIEERERYIQRERDKRREELARIEGDAALKRAKRVLSRSRRKPSKTKSKDRKKARRPAAPATTPIEDPKPKSTAEFMKTRRHELRREE